MTAVWLEGTGRFAGLYGIADVVAEASGVAPGSTFQYVDEGVWYLP